MDVERAIAIGREGPAPSESQDPAWLQAHAAWVLAAEVERLREVVRAADATADVVHADLRAVLTALDLGTQARTYSSHDVVHCEIIPTIERLRAVLGRISLAGCEFGGYPCEANEDDLCGPCLAQAVIAAAPAPAAKPGDRVEDGGQMGTLVRCPKCGGGGLLHDPDELPPAVSPACCTRLDNRHAPSCPQRCQDCGGPPDGPGWCRCAAPAPAEDREPS